MVSCNVLSCWTQLVVFFFFAGYEIFMDSDLKIQISKNGLHLKLKLHPLWRTAQLKIQKTILVSHTHPLKFISAPQKAKHFIGHTQTLATQAS